MKVLITGGSGYNGSILAIELARAGHEVICLDPKGQPAGFEFWLDERSAKRVEFNKTDLFNEPEVRALVKDCQAIVHLAFLVGGPACKKEPDKAKELAIQGTQIILNARDQQLLIFTSTDSVYGNKALGLINEDFNCEPSSYYGELKLACEKMIASADGERIIFRLPTNFGLSPTMRSDLLTHSLVLEMWRTGIINLFEGHITRTMIHVRDVALAMKFAIENRDKLPSGTYNIAGFSLTKRDMARIIAEVFDGQVFEENSDKADPETRDFVLDCSRINNAGWKPRYNLLDGVRSLQSYLQALRQKAGA